MHWRNLATALLVTWAVASVVSAKEEPHRTGWWVAAAPRVQWLTGDGYDLLFGRGVLSGRGYGGELHLGYGFTRRVGARLAVSTAHHTTMSGTGGAAWASVDILLRQPIGRLDLHVFGRFGKQAVAVDGFTRPGPGNTSQTTTDLTVIGHLGGGGGGMRYWVTPHISLGSEAAYTYVGVSDTVNNNGTGTLDPLDKTYDGTTWGVTILAVEYHW